MKRPQKICRGTTQRAREELKKRHARLLRRLGKKLLDEAPTKKLVRGWDD